MPKVISNAKKSRTSTRVPTCPTRLSPKVKVSARHDALLISQEQPYQRRQKSTNLGNDLDEKGMCTRKVDVESPESTEPPPADDHAEEGPGPLKPIPTPPTTPCTINAISTRQDHEALLECSFQGQNTHDTKNKRSAHLFEPVSSPVVRTADFEIAERQPSIASDQGDFPLFEDVLCDQESQSAKLKLPVLKKRLMAAFWKVQNGLELLSFEQIAQLSSVNDDVSSSDPTYSHGPETTLSKPELKCAHEEMDHDAPQLQEGYISEMNPLEALGFLANIASSKLQYATELKDEGLFSSDLEHCPNDEGADHEEHEHVARIDAAQMDSLRRRLYPNLTEVNNGVWNAYTDSLDDISKSPLTYGKLGTFLFSGTRILKILADIEIDIAHETIERNQLKREQMLTHMRPNPNFRPCMGGPRPIYPYPPPMLSQQQRIQPNISASRAHLFQSVQLPSLMAVNMNMQAYSSVPLPPTQKLHEANLTREQAAATRAMNKMASTLLESRHREDVAAQMQQRLEAPPCGPYPGDPNRSGRKPIHFIELRPILSQQEPTRTLPHLGDVLPFDSQQQLNAVPRPSSHLGVLPPMHIPGE